MEELQVQVKVKAGEIVCNFDEVKDALRNQMQAYQELEVTEENIPERKADVATLRKIMKAADDRRKAVKAEFLVPLNEYEAKAKELNGIIEEQVSRINDGLNIFEQKRIEEKRIACRALYDQEIGDLAEYLPYGVIKSSRWDNKTVLANEIISEIQTAKMKVRNDLNTIKALGSEIEEKLLAVYKSSGNNLASAVQKNTEYLETKKAAEIRVRAEAEAKAREEEERREEERRAEEARKIASEAQWGDKEQTPSVPQKAEPEEFPFPEEPVLTIRVKGADDIEALKDFLQMAGIEYEEVRA